MKKKNFACCIEDENSNTCIPLPPLLCGVLLDGPIDGSEGPVINNKTEKSFHGQEPQF